MIIIFTIEFSKDRLSQITELWNSNFSEHYHITENMLLKKVFDDRNFLSEGSFLLTDGKSGIIGFIITKINNGSLPEQDDCAWISSLLIDENFRRQGYGKKLYSAAEGVLKGRQVKKVIIGGEAENFFSGIPQPEDCSVEFFRRNGFIINDSEHYDLMADVSQIDFIVFNQLNDNEGDYTSREASEADRKPIDLFLGENFPGRWRHEVMGYLNNGGNPGNIILLLHHDEIRGFCKTFTDDKESSISASSYAGLGPVGISSDIRGKGLGRKLLLDSLKLLKRRGAHDVLIDWTILKDFYGQFGFKPFRTYRGAYKHI